MARPVMPVAEPVARGPQRPATGPVAEPVVLGPLSLDARAGWMAAWASEQVIARLRDRGDVYTDAAYEMGEALRELSRPERYRDELGHGSLEELLVVHGLPCRSTAHKFVRVVTTYSLAEVKWLGGMEKCYRLIRGVEREDPHADPRSVLEPGARVAGLDVRAASARELLVAQRRLQSGRGPTAGGPTAGGPGVGGPAAPGGPGVGVGGPGGGVFGGGLGGPVRGPVRGPVVGVTGPDGPGDGATDLPDPGAPRRAAARPRRAARRAAILTRIRVHHENGKPCIAAHFDVGPALQLVELMHIGLAHAPAPSPAPS